MVIEAFGLCLQAAGLVVVSNAHSLVFEAVGEGQLVIPRRLRSRFQGCFRAFLRSSGVLGRREAGVG